MKEDLKQPPILKCWLFEIMCPPPRLLCPLDKWKMGRDRIPKLSSCGPLFGLIKPYNCVQSGQGTEGMTFYFLCDKVNLVPLLSRNNYVSMIGTDSSEAERLLLFRSPFQCLPTALLFSPFFPTRGLWRQERGAPGGMKRENHFSSLYLHTASCAAELKIHNLVSKSISTSAWPTE